MRQGETTAYCLDKGIQLEASSPLGNGQVLTNDILCEMAESKGVSTAALCLKWELKHGAVVIPKTTNENRLKENLQLDDFDLTEEEMGIIDSLSFCGGLGIDPDEATNFDGL